MMTPDLQAEALRGGSLDSSGSFSMDVERALEKLKGFSLPDPYFYILKLIQSSVAKGSRNFQLDAGSAALRLSYEGLVEDAHSIEALLTQLARSGPERELAAGILGICQLKPSSLWVRCSSPQGTFHHQFSAGRWQTRQLSPNPSESVEIWWKRPPRERWRDFTRRLLGHDILDILEGRPHTQRRELELLRRRCGFGGICLLLNGRPLQANCFGAPRYPGHRPELACPQKVPAAFLQGRQQQYAWEMADKEHHWMEHHEAANNASSSLVLLQSSHPSWCLQQRLGQPLFGAYGLRAGLQPMALIKFVRQGVLIDELELDLGFPGLHAVVSADHLRTDITGFKLVEDQPFRLMLNHIRERAIDLHSKVGRTGRRLPERARTLLKGTRQDPGPGERGTLACHR